MSMPLPMKRRHLTTTACLACLALGVQAADPEYFNYRDLLATRSVKSFTNPAVKIYLANDAKPEFAEKPGPTLIPAPASASALSAARVGIASKRSKTPSAR